MSQARGKSGHEPFKTFKSIVFPGHCTDLITVLRGGVLLFLIASISLVLYSVFTSQPLWFRCPECPDPTQNIVHACDAPDPTYTPTDISHIVFGISGSTQTWNHRRIYAQLWWQPNRTRGFVWLDAEPPPYTLWPENSPPHRVSSDWTRFKYSSSQSAVRIARVILDSFRLGLPDVRWFVMGDDDTVFFTENLVTVLSKYDHREMYYIGGNSESVEQDVMHAYDMAFGGGGFAISYPLAAELSRILDGCLNRYYNFYGSDQRVWACVKELGVPLTRERGFHQIDIRGDPFGLLAAHPMAPLVSLHHLDYVSPMFPNHTQYDSLKTLIKAYQLDPPQILQQCLCYDRWYKWSVSVSWGYAVQIYPSLLKPMELEMPSQTFKTWRSSSDGPFTFNTRPLSPDPCEQPVRFHLELIQGDGKGGTISTYRRSVDEVQKKCKKRYYARAMAIERIVVSALKMDNHKWMKNPRRQCCDIKSSNSGIMKVKIRRCKYQESITP